MKERKRRGSWARLLAEWPPLRVDKHDSVCDCLLQPFTNTITLFIQLTDNEQAGFGAVYTVYLLFYAGRDLDLSACLAVELHACVAAAVCTSRSGRRWHCLPKGPMPFPIDVSSQAELLSSSLREEIENGERHRGLIDPASVIRLFVRKGGERKSARERRRKRGTSY